ncbi:TetR family transcriptional regulator [Stenotrophomonas sp. SbOxS2]|uniref:TetR family transcriptional regulator n=1 Tax=Stenotrophomonas sp. SbOxS2 TaxID=2723885 RepID=UPI00211EFFE3|nr:TetR family transcriptional regulator [Stenotrophomonas sp. SbOxS2]
MDKTRVAHEMARKTRAEALATRQGLLDAARDCFHEYGVACTSLEMICSKAGYTRGALYWHFKNKTEVLEALVSREHDPFIERLRRTTSAERTTPIVDLRSALLVSFKEVAEDVQLRNMMEIMLRNDLSVESQAMRAMQRNLLTEELDILSSALTRAAEIGQLKEGVDVRAASRSLLSCLIGVLYSAMLEPALYELERDGMEAIDAILSVYATPGAFEPGSPAGQLPPLG